MDGKKTSLYFTQQDLIQLEGKIRKHQREGAKMQMHSMKFDENLQYMKKAIPRKKGIKIYQINEYNQYDQSYPMFVFSLDEQDQADIEERRNWKLITRKKYDQWCEWLMSQNIHHDSLVSSYSSTSWK